VKIIIIIMLVIKKRRRIHNAITYFCKESLEEFPVLELDVVKKGGGDGGERGDKA